MLTRVKTILNVQGQDILLEELISLVSEKVFAYIGEHHIPQHLEWIVVELAIQRFNRIGSEGMSVEGVDGNSNSYFEDELTPFYAFLDEYKALKNGNINVKGYKLL